MKSILMIAGDQDSHELCAYPGSLGLRLIAMSPGRSLLPAAEIQGCYVTYLQESELRLHANGTRLSDALNPMLFFNRPFYSAPYLVDGGLHLNCDGAISQEIRPTFEKIRRWVRKSWHKTPEHASYVGPQALELLTSGKAEWRSHMHGAKITYVGVPTLR